MRRIIVFQPNNCLFNSNKNVSELRIKNYFQPSRWINYICRCAGELSRVQGQRPFARCEPWALPVYTRSTIFVRAEERRASTRIFRYAPNPISALASFIAAVGCFTIGARTAGPVEARVAPSRKLPLVYSRLTFHVRMDGTAMRKGCERDAASGHA